MLHDFDLHANPPTMTNTMVDIKSKQYILKTGWVQQEWNLSQRKSNTDVWATKKDEAESLEQVNVLQSSIQGYFSLCVWLAEHFWAMSLRHSDKFIIDYKACWSDLHYSEAAINGRNGIDNENVCHFVGAIVSGLYDYNYIAPFEMEMRRFTRWKKIMRKFIRSIIIGTGAGDSP